MSYCVNCGVQLDKTAKRCPLCNTPVINPSEAIDTVSKTPYPQKRGQVEQVYMSTENSVNRSLKTRSL